MRTITKTEISEIIIKNSRFITILFPINQDSNTQELINQAKIKYPKANHYCYAYITTENQKSSDDGEPGGTAGLPMLNVLLKEDMINILAVTVRYFGGIKLGAGGLVRAYTKAVSDAITNAKIIFIEKGYKINIDIPYNEQKNLEHLLKDCTIINKKYQETVIYEVLINKDKLSSLNNYKYKIIEKEYIKSSK